VVATEIRALGQQQYLGGSTGLGAATEQLSAAIQELSGAAGEILTALANNLGYKWNYTSPQEILLEIADTNPFYSGLTWEDLRLH